MRRTAVGVISMLGVLGLAGVLGLGVLGAGCASSSRDRADAGGDALNECAPEGNHRCTGSSYEVCTDQRWVNETDCLQGCIDSLGCVACTPNENFCMGGDVWSCDPTGQAGALVESCSGVNTCEGGGCVDACASAASNKSYIGCEYWAVDLDNAVEVWGVLSASACTTTYRGTVTTTDVCFKTMGPFVTTAGLCDPPFTMGGAATCPSGFACGPQAVCVSDAQRSPFAVVVSNPQSRDVSVTLTGPGGQTMVRTIGAGQVVPLLPQQNAAIPDQSIDGSQRARRAYKLTSDLPIVAYQFNPLDNVNVFSNDASLLIPRTAFDADYFAMSMPTLDRRATAPGKNSYYGYLAVVAWQDGTQISVTPTVAIVASATQAPIAANTTATFTLDAFDVLQLEAAAGGDLTGTRITSNNATTFGVFGGHEATVFGETTPPDAQHTSGPCCADHLEEMMFPAATWGKSFAIARSQPRTNEPDLLRILAQKPNTTVTFDPAPASGTCGTLAAGQFCEVKVMVDTEVAASEPVLVGHFLEASTWQANNNTTVGTGDPSMALAVPVEQYRTEYTVLIPAAYQMNYLSLSAAATGGVTVDGAPVALSAFPSGGRRVARIPVTAGQHKIQCADGCGVTVYGYSDSVSYMFAGGLDLKAIVIF